jgi:hypothetical protein
MGNWRKQYFCVHCDERLYWSEKMSSQGCCPFCGHTVKGNVCETVERGVELKTGNLRVAWTIYKLKVVRGLLKPLLRLHIWWETRHQRKVLPSHTEGPIGRDAIRKAVARVNKGRRS